MTYIEDCEVCLAISETNPIFETDNWIVSLSPNQAYLGHSLVTLKEHKADLKNLTTEEWLDFADLVKSFESAVRGAFDTTLFNWGCNMNNSFRTKRSFPHVHWHVRPRYEKIVQFEQYEFVDTLFGNHYDNKLSNKVDVDILDIIKSKIQVNL